MTDVGDILIVIDFLGDIVDTPMGIARPRVVHKTSVLGLSVHVPYCTSIHVFFQPTAAC